MAEFILLLGLGSATAIGAIAGAVADIDDRSGAALRGGATGLGLGLTYLAAAKAYRAFNRPPPSPPIRVNNPQVLNPFLNLDLRTRDQRLIDAKRKMLEGRSEYDSLTGAS